MNAYLYKKAQKRTIAKFVMRSFPRCINKTVINVEHFISLSTCKTITQGYDDVLWREYCERNCGKKDFER